MAAANRQEQIDTDPRIWAPPLRGLLSELIAEAFALAPQSSIEETARKWLGRASSAPDPDAFAELAMEAGFLAMELSIFAPSFTGVRPVDRLARNLPGKQPEYAMAMQWLRKGKFTLFRILREESDCVYEARDLATGESFRLFEDRLAPSALQMDLAARICPIPGGLHALVGPTLTLGLGGVSKPGDYIRPGKGIGNDQRCAQLVYRDHVRRGTRGEIDSVLTPSRPVVISQPDEQLDELARELFESGAGANLNGDALAEARNLTSPARILAALTSCVEIRAEGRPDGADIYRALARVLIETLHERARVGSHPHDSLEKLRADLRTRVENKITPLKALELFDEIAGGLVARTRPDADRDDDLTRVIERIRGLRAKTTEQGCTEQEALRAAEKVAELLERYGLSLSEIEMRKQTCEGFGFDTGRRKREPSDNCIPAIAGFCDCRVWLETSATGSIRHVFFGLPADVEAARCLNDLMLGAFVSETAAFKLGKLYQSMQGAERRAATSSFQIGLASGISMKLHTLKAEREKAMSKSSGRDLVVVKTSILDEEIEKLGLSFHNQRSRSRRKVISEAYARGEATGRQFKVNEVID
jgi:hypothetical protein